jgi:heme oxygenase
VLLGEVRQRLGDVPVTFLAGYGEATGRRWQSVRRAMVDVVAAAADPDAAERRLVAAARSTFDHLDALLTTAGWPVITDDHVVRVTR